MPTSKPQISLAYLAVLCMVALMGCAQVDVRSGQVPHDPESIIAGPAEPNLEGTNSAPPRTSPNAEREYFPTPPTGASEVLLNTSSDAMQASPSRPHPDVPSFRQEDRSVWATLRAGWAIPQLPVDVQATADQTWRARRDFVQRSFLRSREFIPLIVAELKRRNLPMELALLPLVESGYQAHVVSSADAAGPWQFIRSTGRSFGLHDSRFARMRSDWLASTRASLDYLTKLHAMFGDWHLALAAYNWGEGSVARAIDRNQRLGQAATFDALAMPAETAAYVPAVLALRRMIDDPQGSGLNLPGNETNESPKVVNLRGKDIDVALISRWSGIREAEILRLNPAISSVMAVATMTPAILLPADGANRFELQSSRYQGLRATYSAHIVSIGERIATIAKKCGMTIQTLRRVNAIPTDHEPKVGSTLLVPRVARSNRDISWEVATGARLETQRITAHSNKSPVKKRVAAGRGEPAVKGAKRVQQTSINQVFAAATSDQTPSDITASAVVCHA